ncbi:VOC family protein [Bosea sp. 124]|uniref:VOC family protein n=1 Tax=Bosea sp. 124 TaxID=2135642 RepID=UPI000D465EA1|nr:VOC family protein [Bosea sp. 124]PTM39235.1 glyoxalase-like protein [Bosea sp. 124]
MPQATPRAGEASLLLQLDHISVVAPTLAEGVSHVRACLDLDVPFGQHHGYMGTHNHLLQLGGSVYLEIVALDPDGRAPGRSRWFGLDDRANVRAAWDEGRRLRGWVARVDGIDAVLAGRETVFGRKVALPVLNPSFDFSIPEDGSLPLDGALPSLIDRRGKPRAMATMADLGARLRSLVLEHPEPAAVSRLYRELTIDRPPDIVTGPSLRYRARIETPAGLKELT